MMENKNIDNVEGVCGVRNSLRKDDHVGIFLVLMV